MVTILQDFQKNTLWKKVVRKWQYPRDPSNEFVLELLIPNEALQAQAPHSQKCRVSTAFVLRAFSLVDGAETSETEFRSIYDQEFVYRVGEAVTVLDFDPNPAVECTRGIHAFNTRQEAEEHWHNIRRHR